MACSPPRLSVYGIFPGKNTGVSCHFLLQEIFLTQGPNPGLPHWQADYFPLSHQEGLNKYKENETKDLTYSGAKQTKTLETEAEKGLCPSAPQQAYSFSSKHCALLPVVSASWWLRL